MILVRCTRSFLSWITTNGFKLVIGLILLYIGWKIINKVIKILANIMKSRNVDPTLTSFAEAFFRGVSKSSSSYNPNELCWI